jgi:predicted transcriptional regulator
VARISPRWLLRGGIAELGLSQSEALVLLKLLDHLEKGVAWSPQTHMSQELGIARSTVQEAIEWLARCRAVVELEQGRRGRATRYRLGYTEDVDPITPDWRVRVATEKRLRKEARSSVIKMPD